jgi:phosphatidylglycerol:prolipoprotein diacylglycerol transferase
MTELLSINIGLDPNVTKIGGLLITWHGVFTAIGIVAGVWLAVRIAESPRVGIDGDTAYTIGMIVVACGLVGARALYVLENYGDSPTIDSVGDIFRITEGGISIYGAIIGGAIGGWIYAWRTKLRAAAGSDAAVFGMLLGMAIGRIGDLINGEHLAKATSLPWGVTYSHINSPGFEHSFALGPTHPATTYEMIFDIVIIGVLAVMWRLRPKSGVIFVSAFLLYAVMRFCVSFLRVDSHYPLLGLSTPQVTSLLVIIVGLPLLVYFMRREEPEYEAHLTPAERARRSMSRAERRRRLRTGT